MYSEILDSQEQAVSDSYDSARLQMIMYLGEAPITPSVPPLAYWQINKSFFPALAEAAQVYLGAPCTSVNSERLFSTPTLLMQKK